MNAVAQPSTEAVVTTAATYDQVARPSFNGARSLTEALVQAYYQRDVDAVRRIAASPRSASSAWRC